MKPFLTTGRAAGAIRLVLLVMAAGCSSLVFLVMAAGASNPQPSAAPAAAPQVGVYRVEPQRQAITTELPGRTSARLVAEIRPQVGGIVQRRLFEEGAQVRAGQVLYQIDPASFQASHASAQASVAKAEAALNSARVTAQRNAELVKIDAISQQLNDDSQAALTQAQADLEVTRAALATARINLDRTRVTADLGPGRGLGCHARRARHRRPGDGADDRAAARPPGRGRGAVQQRVAAPEARPGQRRVAAQR